MKYVDEYRDPAPVHAVIAQIRATVTRQWVLMEVCGGQTHNIIRHGIDQLLPPELELVHGPGCPVCVTPLELIDQALAIAGRPEVIFCSFGDMLRVPGSDTNLFRVKAEGGDVRVLYSPLDALEIAQQNPDREVVFFGVGFETTAPANAMAILQAHRLNITNFSVLVSHVRVPPAINALLSTPAIRVQAFLAAGHVCAVMGYWEYHPLAERFGVPIVVTGFEPLDIVRGILMAVQQLETGRTQVENAYVRTVTEAGNTPAQQVIEQVFQECDRKWRGIGEIPGSGWCVRPDFASFDAARRFETGQITAHESPLCHAGEVLQGLLKPYQCPAFGTDCTPRTPLGAPMVSAEGACAAYHNYGRF
ncbi:MAG: hydrogenase formation protein HypD, partial [Anaerolineales bacterium]|nr:hydrogenase formation protein HypD [Anaerolineales bacterium]